jgi:uncharacterized protein YgiM (DUF1202 family)
MKTTFLPALALLLASTLIPQTTQASSPPVIDAAGDALETAPATSRASAALQPGSATVAGRNVNVRAKATIKSEVVAQLQDGDEVFIEEVILRPEAAGKDPNRWAKIAYPAKASAWVHSLYIDAATSTVKPKKLNVRAGAGENFTVIGTLHSGDVVAPLGTKGGWISIQPPEGTTAYVAAKLLRQQVPVTEVAMTETEVVETAVVTDRPEVAAGADPGEVEMVAVTETSETVVVEGATSVQDTNELAAAMGLEPLPEIAPEMEVVPDEPLPPRIVDREGIVRAFTSIQAPSDYKLVSADNGRTINYLYTTSTNLDLGRYLGLHIIATGEESLDRRWPNMPVLTLKRIVLIE